MSSSSDNQQSEIDEVDEVESVASVESVESVKEKIEDDRASTRRLLTKMKEMKDDDVDLTKTTVFAIVEKR